MAQLGLWARNDKTPSSGVSLEAAASEKVVYVGQYFEYSLFLYTDTPNISGFSNVNEPELTNLSVVAETNVDSSLRRVKTDDGWKGKAEVEKFILTADKAGEARIGKGIYSVSVSESSGRYDFFGFPMMNTYRVNVETEPIKIKVKPLPKAPDGFSGAIGSFTIDCRAADSSMAPGSEMTVAFVVEGRGNLPSDLSFDFKQLFPAGLRLKSVEQQERSYYRNGRFCRRLTYQCLFTAIEEGEHTIKSVTLTYFNPETKKYESVESPSTTITVGQSHQRRQSSEGGLYVENSTLKSTLNGLHI